MSIIAHDQAFCGGVDCAWWDFDREMCSVRSSVEELADLNLSVQNVRDALLGSKQWGGR